MSTDLFQVLAEGDPKAAFPVVEHLARHQRVEHGCTRQWYTKVEAEQPPDLCVPVELQKNKHIGVSTLLKTVDTYDFMIYASDVTVTFASLKSSPKKKLYFCN